MENNIIIAAMMVAVMRVLDLNFMIMLLFYKLIRLPILKTNY